MKIELFRQLCMNYNKEPDEDLYLLWNDNLRCYDDSEMQKAVGKIITQDKYFPNLNRILEVVKEIVSREESEITEESKREKMKRLNIKPSWLDSELTSTIEEDTDFTDFTDFINEFRGVENE